MAHKVLVGGTEYDVVGGKTLVNGAAYSIVNGKVLIGGTEYDIPFKVADFEDIWDSDEAGGAVVNCVKYANGYWVVGGTRYKNGVSYACIAYTTNLRNWITKDLWNNVYPQKNLAGVMCIEYADGYWVAGGFRYDGKTPGDVNTGTYAMFGYSTTPYGQWESYYVWSAIGHGRPTPASVNFIKAADGAVVIGGIGDSTHNDSVEVRSALIGSFPGSTSWADIALDNTGLSLTNTNIFDCIEYADGYWCIGGSTAVSGSTDGGDSYDGYAGAISYTTDLSGEWTTRVLIDPPLDGPPLGPAGSARITSIKHADGKWMFGGIREHSTYLDENPAVVLCSCESLSGSVTYDYDGEQTESSESSPYVDSLNMTYGNGCWVVAVNSSSYGTHSTKIMYLHDDTWAQIDMWGSGVINCMLCDNGYWFCGGYYDTFARIAWARKHITNYEKLQLM